MSQDNQHSLLKLIGRFLKIGCIGFGGGTALIPVIGKELVGTHPKITQQELDKQVIVASITPGALPVEVACGIGKSAYGMEGMLTAAFAMALPGVLMTVLFLSFLSVAGQGVLSFVSYIAVGVTLFILLVITQYIIGVIRKIPSKRKGIAVGMVAVVFLLNGGKQISPLFGISTLEILCIAFFVLCYTEGNVWTWRTIPAVIISGIFLLVLGNISVFSERYVAWAVEILMLVLAVKGLVHSVYVTRSIKVHKKDLDGFVKEMLCWVVVLVLLCIPAVLIIHNIISYLGAGFFSSVISFGGGDAYLTVADALFVDSGWISKEIFYNHIIPIVNASPGSVLCETLSAVGYQLGYQFRGSIWDGYFVAMAGFAVSVTASCVIFLSIQRIYEKFEVLHIFQVLRRWMGTIIGGLLISVGVSLLKNNLSVLQKVGIGQLPAIGVCVAIYLLNLLLSIKFKWNSMVLLVLSGLLSLGICLLGSM